MLRRSVVGLCGLAFLVAAGIAPWTSSAPRLSAWVERHLAEALDVAVEIDGPVVVTLLPTPRLAFDARSIKARDGVLLARDAAFKGRFEVGALLRGTVRLAELSLRHPRLFLAFDENGDSAWRAVVRKVGGEPGRAERDGALARVTISSARLEIELASGFRTDVQGVDFLLRWPNGRRELDVLASGTWRGEPIRLSLGGLDPFRLLDGGSDAVDLVASSPLAVATLKGALAWPDGPSFRGSVDVEIGSLGPFVRWLDLAPHLRSIERPVKAVGQGSLGRDGMAVPRAELAVAGDKLDGSLHVGLGGARPKVRATLAGDRVDLTWLGRWLQDTAGTIDVGASGEVSLADYDLRLSASALQLDGLKLSDAALALLVDRERIDLSLARAGLAAGTVKGRITSAAAQGARDLKGQLTLDRIEVGALLGQLGQPPLATGLVGGQASFETSADGRAEAARRLTGRLALTARDGELHGLSLAEPRRRADRKVDPLAPWRGGRTAFDSAHLVLAIANGVAEIADGSIGSGSALTTVQGRASLADRLLSLKITTRPSLDLPHPRPALVLEVNGPWHSLVALPSADAAPSAPR